MLNAWEVGKGSPVVLVHGFTQTSRSWEPVVDRLAPLHHFTLVDAPGHGRSAAVVAGLWDGAQRLGEVGGRAGYVGYSMGGRLCLHLALERPDLVGCLVLVGSHPGIVDAGQRAARRAEDDALARQLTNEGVAAFVDRWLTQSLFSTLSPTAAQREERLANSATGLAASLRRAGLGSQQPLWQRLPELTMPVLVVAGELDTKFADLGRSTVEAIGTNAELVLIPGAGHACHLERPDPFCLILADFLADSCERDGVERDGEP